MSGVATFADTSEGLRVALDVRNLPEPGATYLAHVHSGRCADDAAARQDHGHHGSAESHVHDHHPGKPEREIEHPLIPVVADPDGAGSNTTVIEGTTVAQLFSDTNLHVNVHAEATGSEEPPDTFACGDLMPGAGMVLRSESR